MSWLQAIPAFIAVALLGWLGGMLTFKRSLTWCKQCGESLTCSHCVSPLAGKRRNMVGRF